MIAVMFEMATFFASLSGFSSRIEAIRSTCSCSYALRPRSVNEGSCQSGQSGRRRWVVLKLLDGFVSCADRKGSRNESSKGVIVEIGYAC